MTNGPHELPHIDYMKRPRMLSKIGGEMTLMNSGTLPSG